MGGLDICHRMKKKNMVVMSEFYYLFQGITGNIVSFFLLFILLVGFLKR